MGLLKEVRGSIVVEDIFFVSDEVLITIHILLSFWEISFANLWMNYVLFFFLEELISTILIKDIYATVSQIISSQNAQQLLGSVVFNDLYGTWWVTLNVLLIPGIPVLSAV